MTIVRQISIVLPMLNEEANAARVVEELIAAFSASEWDLNVVAVNDGSDDNTGQIVNDLSAQYAIVRAAHHETRRGYGAAIRTGLAMSESRVIGWMDGDGQYDPRDFMQLLTHLEQGAIGAIGVRSERADPGHRRILGHSGTRLASRIVGTELRDADTGIKVFDRDAVQVRELKANGSFISTEVLSRAITHGEVVQMDVSPRPRTAGKQTGASPRVLYGLLRDFLRHKIC